MHTNRLATVIALCRSDMGFNPLAIYCQYTGKPFGFITESELSIVIQQCNAEDDDSLISDLWTRTMASARPSPAWNYIRKESMEIMLQNQPRDLLAYLLNRLYDPLDNGALTFESRLGITAQHVSVYEAIQRMQISSDSLGRLLLALLNLDGKFGLRHQQRPSELLRLDWFLAHPHSVEGLIRNLNEWLDSLQDAFEKAEKKALSTARFTEKANTQVKAAFTVQALKYRPPSKKSVVDTAKRVERDFLASILDSIWVEADMAKSADAAALREQPKVGLTPSIPGVLLPGQPRPRFGAKKVESVA